MPPTLPEDEAFEANDNPADQTPEPEMSGEGMPGELCVPLAALAEPDDKEQMTPPTVGDKAQANIEYTVNRVEGDNAYISLDAVNGQKLGKGTAPTEDEEMESLRGMASQQPERY